MKLFYFIPDSSMSFKYSSDGSDSLFLNTLSTICSTYIYKRLAIVSIPKNAKLIHHGKFICTNKWKIEKVINTKDWEMWDDEDFCLNAVKQTRNALRFVRNQTEAIV